MSISIELPDAIALFTGVSEGDLGRTSGEPAAAVARNRTRLLATLDLSAISVPSQVHGSAVASAAATGGYDVGACEADAVLCTQPGVGAGVHVADCLPIVVAGPGALVVIHAGWRGLAAGVVEAAVARLREHTKPCDGAIGPGVGACCYEAGFEVHGAFASYRASSGRLLDLRAVARAKLREAGVARVSVVDLCTLCAAPGTLFSHRREGPDSGRQAGIAWLR